MPPLWKKWVLPGGRGGEMKTKKKRNITSVKEARGGNQKKKRGLKKT